MNAHVPLLAFRETLMTFCDTIEKNSWLDPRIVNASMLASMSTFIQNEAQKLLKLEEARIKDLKDNGPRVDSDVEISICLLRDGKEKYFSFGEYQVEVVRTDRESDREQFGLTGPPDEDGFTYFIRAAAPARTYGQQLFGIWITKEEAPILMKGFSRSQTWSD